MNEVENEIFQLKALKHLKLKKEHIQELIRKNKQSLKEGRFESLGIKEETQFDLISYLVDPKISRIDELSKMDQLYFRGHGSYMVLMLKVALHALVNHPELKSEDAALKSLYYWRRHVFLLRHRGRFVSNDVDYGSFVSYMKEFYDMDLKIIKKIIDDYKKEGKK